MYVPDRLAAAVQQLVEQRGTTYAQFLRDALRRELAQPHLPGATPEVVAGLLEQLLDRLDRVTGRTCPGCAQPRPVDVTFTDAIAHAQCDQIVARLDDKAQEPVS